MENTHAFRKPNSTLRAVACGSVVWLLAACASQQPPAVAATPSGHAELHTTGDSAQETFATPQEAVDALVSASRRDDKAQLIHILGARADKLISSGDAVADHDARQKFVEAYDKEHSVENTTDGNAVLLVGDNQWPMPIPVVHTGNGWKFDSAAGEEEILNRRIGRNELNAIGVCRSYVEAQHEFADQADGEYAQHFHSHDGKHDGLYWPAAEGEDESPFGDLIADAMVEGYSPKAISKHVPYEGYFYYILKSQGPHASTGAKNYIVNGRMVNGFALIAFPARYGDSGVMTFIVNQNGIVYEKNLGPNTVKYARHIDKFDPDASWNIVR